MTMRHIAVLLGGFCLVSVGGCASATIEDAVPATAMQPPAQAAFSTPGEYPNLNVKPTPAAAQFTDEELKAQTEALRATREQQAQEADGRRAADRSVELRKLGQSHADAALEEIESQ